jgi:hypothetical protein
MTFRGIGADQRRSPRIEVWRQVKGHLIELDTPIVVHDLSRTGFAVVSEAGFEPGDTLEFRLEADRPGTAFRVAARAVHTRPSPQQPGLFLTGFMFIPSPILGVVPQAQIDRLISLVTESQRGMFAQA